MTTERQPKRTKRVRSKPVATTLVETPPIDVQPVTLPEQLADAPLPTDPEDIGDEELIFDDDTEPLSYEEDMSESNTHHQLIDTLESTLKHFLASANWFITGNFALYPPDAINQYDHTDPDLAVFIGVPTPTQRIKSWKVGNPDRPVPQVVFEVASEGTWLAGLQDKPTRYTRIGVQEYYAYDPDTPRTWKTGGMRLRGWHRQGRMMVELKPDVRGRLWSPTLSSFLVPQDDELWLTDINSRKRLSSEEALQLVQTQLVQADAARIEAEQQRAEEQRQRIEAERKAEAMAARLRALGENPDDM